MNRFTKSSLALLAMACSSSAWGQNFNIDFSGTGTAPPGPAPASTYGAAANQVGFWNNVTNPAAAGVVLNDLSNLVTAVTISLDGGFHGAFTGPNSNATTAGSDAELLLDDGWDPTGLDGVITIANLAAGVYDIYTYGVAPDSITDLTGVTVVGAVQGNQQVGGALPNPFNDQYALGLTHALHTVTVTAGSNVVINIDNAGGGFETVNGIQIVTVPGPGALALFGLAGFVGTRRRRG
jgi:MYXO-CTERM domain-containing protein